jgi:hypothetical protein
MNQRPPRPLLVRAWWVLVVVPLVLSFLPKSQVFGQAGETSPSREAERDPTAVLKELLAKQRDELKLSNQQPKAKFNLLVVLAPKDGTAAKASLDTFWICDGDSVFTVALSGDGKEFVPCCIAANGVAVGLDPRLPGGIVFAESAQPLVQIAGDTTNNSTTFIHGLRLNTGARPEVIFDPATILDAFLPKIRNAEYDAKKRLLFHGEHSTIRVGLPKPDEKIPAAISELSVSNANILISGFVLHDPPYTQKNVSSVTAKSIAALGLPQRRMTTEDAKTLFTGPRKAFHTEPKHRDASAKLNTLLKREAQGGIKGVGSR